MMVSRRVSKDKKIETEPETMSQIGMFGSIVHLFLCLAPTAIIAIG